MGALLARIHLFGGDREARLVSASVAHIRLFRGDHDHPRSPLDLFASGRRGRFLQLGVADPARQALSEARHRLGWTSTNSPECFFPLGRPPWQADLGRRHRPTLCSPSTTASSVGHLYTLDIVPRLPRYSLGLHLSTKPHGLQSLPINTNALLGPRPGFYRGTAVLVVRPSLGS